MREKPKTVREKPQKAQKWSGQLKKGSGRSPKKAQKWSERSPESLANGPDSLEPLGEDGVVQGH